MTWPIGIVEEIDAFLKVERPIGEDVCDDVFLTEHFFPLQRKEELRRMVQIARGRPHDVVMEIGADKGGGVYHWCQCLSPRRVAVCDIRGVPYRAAFSRAFPDVHFLWLACSSRDELALASVDEWLCGSKIDVLFIDGEKSRMYEDFLEYAPRVTSGGTVFVHDIQDDYGREAFSKMKCDVRARSTEEIVLLQDSMEAAQRERDGLPCVNSYEGWLRHWKGASCGVGVVYL